MENIKEITLEKYLVRKVKAHRGMALKFLPYHYAGMPDRLVLKHSGDAVFVEMKRTNDKLRALQKKRFCELLERGFRIYMLDSKESINEFIEKEFKVL